MFAAWGRMMYRFRWIVIALSVLSTALAVGSLPFGGELSSDYFPKGTESGRAAALIDEQIRASSQSATFIFTSQTLSATDPAFKTAMLAALEPARSLPTVAAIRTPFDTGSANPRMVGQDGHSALAVVQLNSEATGLNTGLQAYRELRSRISSPTLQITATGGLAANQDFQTSSEHDLRRAETVSLPIVLLMLLLVFGSAVAAGVPLAVGGLAVVAGYAATLLLARWLSVSVYATNVVTMIGLGVAVDYSLFIVSRFREEVRTRPVPEAIAVTMATAGRAITFSGLTVAIGLLGLTFFSLGVLGSMGMAGTIVVALAVLYGLTFLPALLSVLGGRVNSLRVPFVHPERTGIASHRGTWHRLAMLVMRHPWRVLLPVSALLVLLGAPALHMRLGGADITVLPKNAEARRGIELLRAQFPQTGTMQIPVVVHYPSGSPLTPERVGEVYDLTKWLESLPGVAQVTSATNLAPGLTREQYQQMLSNPQTVPAQLRPALAQSVGANIVVLSAAVTSFAGSDQARDTVRLIRTSHPAVSGEVLVSGATAYDLDSIDSIREDVPKAAAFIMIATYIVLFLLLGSVLLPLKAVLMNLLSITASYGALVSVFQEGHFSKLLDFTPGNIDPTLPVIMGCVLFGLSMDYEVLLLSRIKEEYDAGLTNSEAVAEGLERTGRLITSAAVIMVSVFASFTLAQTTVIKAVGLGMAVAVAMDAAVIRTLIVPSTMRLLGSWNWWAPGPLRRLHSRVGMTESSVVPKTPAVPGAGDAAR